MFWFARMSCQRTVVYTTRSTRVGGERSATSVSKIRHHPSRSPPPPSCGPQAGLPTTPHCLRKLGTQRAAYLFNLKVVRTQRLLDLLLGPARRCLHGTAEPVQHPLESELLHRESRIARILCPKAARAGPGYITAVRRGQRAGFGNSEVGLSRADVAPLRRAVRAPPTPTRARHADNRRELGEAPPPECTAMRSAAGSIPGSGDTRALGPTRATHTVTTRKGRYRLAGKSATRPIDPTARATERDKRI